MGCMVGPEEGLEGGALPRAGTHDMSYGLAQVMHGCAELLCVF